MTWTRWLLLALVALTVPAPPVFACIDGDDLLLEAWQKSVSGHGYDLIIKGSSSGRTYVPEDEGLMMLLMLYATDDRAYDDASKQNKYDAGPPHSKDTACPDKPGTLVIKGRERLAMYQESIQFVLKNGVLLDKSAESKAVRASLESLVKPLQEAKGDSVEIPLKTWCQLGYLLSRGFVFAGGTNLIFTYQSISSSQSFSSLDPKKPTQPFPCACAPEGAFVFGPLPASLNLIFCNLYLPSHLKERRRGCNATIVPFKLAPEPTAPLPKVEKKDP